MRTISLDEAKATIKGYCESDPDRTNGGICRYEHNGDPHCIVGNALHDWGVRTEELAHLDNIALSRISDDLALKTLNDFGFDITPEAVDFLSHVQYVADGGELWGYIPNVVTF